MRKDFATIDRLEKLVLYEGTIIELASWKQIPILSGVTIVCNSPRISLVKLQCALLHKEVRLIYIRILKPGFLIQYNGKPV